MNQRCVHGVLFVGVDLKPVHCFECELISLNGTIEWMDKRVKADTARREIVLGAIAAIKGREREFNSPPDLSAKASDAHCTECGMTVLPNEYHPYLACLAYKACLNPDTVHANIRAIRDHVTEYCAMVADGCDRGARPYEIADRLRNLIKSDQRL
jgi:hypothetical protein